MKLSLGWREAGRCAAFTLIELLAVMAIILVLAGLIINVAGSAQYNSAKSRATSEIQAMSTALENYKSDNGVYPSDPNSSELLDPKATFDPNDSRYAQASTFLYRSLSGFTIDPATNKLSGAVGKAYMTFTVQQLKVVTATDTVSPTNPNMYLIDPFGFSYGYSTIYTATQTANNAKSPPDTTAITKGYNPTFDLWSTAGYASGGKSTPTTNPPGATTPAAVYSALWVKNW